MSDLAIRLEQYKQRALRGEALTIDEMKEIVAFMRELRGKARPAPPTKAAKSSAPSIPIKDLLKGLA